MATPIDSENCSTTKKVKTRDENDDIFISFHKNHLQTLEHALAYIQSSLSGYGVGILKIKNCDALTG
jgi:hypothetical protein